MLRTRWNEFLPEPWGSWRPKHTGLTFKYFKGSNNFGASAGDTGKTGVPPCGVSVAWRFVPKGWAERLNNLSYT
jgi:hypothetical protein